MPNWKIPAVSGAAGFLLSGVVGLAASVGAGTVFVRAFVSAVVFAAFGLGIQILWDRFFSNLSEPESSGSGESDSGEAGQKVDIVVEDAEESLRFSGPDEAGEALESVREPSGPEAEASAPVFEAGPETPEPQSPAGGRSSESPESPVPPAESSQELLGGLPDLDQFSDSFRTVAEGFSDGTDVAPGAPAPRSGVQSVDVMGQEHNTQEIAKAVQTILKKDQEG